MWSWKRRLLTVAASTSRWAAPQPPNVTEQAKPHRSGRCPSVRPIAPKVPDGVSADAQAEVRLAAAMAHGGRRGLAPSGRLPSLTGAEQALNTSLRV